MREERLDTAHQAWDRWWGDAQQRTRWSEPEPAVAGFIPALQARGARRVLDVGAGIGRHALAYARAGFEVTAIDASPVGLGELARCARAEKLTIDTRIGSFSALLVKDAFVDHMLAWNVLYHGDQAVAGAALAECRRVLRPGGTIQLTMLSKRNHADGIGRGIRPDTFVDDSSSGDKNHPHLYVDASRLCSLIAGAGFEAMSIVDVDYHPPGAWHWEVLAEAHGVPSG